MHLQALTLLLMVCKMDKHSLFIPATCGDKYNSHKLSLCCDYPSQFLCRSIYTLHIRLVVSVGAIA